MGWILDPAGQAGGAVHPGVGGLERAGLGEPVFRLRLVGFGDRGPASGEQ